MPSKPLPMKLSRDEDLFLRHWMHDEWHFREARGTAKQLQLQQRAVPADLADVIAAAYPDPDEQHSIAVEPPPVEEPVWPWTSESLAVRVAEARQLLDECRQAGQAYTTDRH